MTRIADLIQCRADAAAALPAVTMRDNPRLDRIQKLDAAIVDECIWLGISESEAWIQYRPEQ